jgi:retron-type reverse transcriptase
MPPRSYYVEPRPSDYIAIAQAMFPEDLDTAKTFSRQHKVPFIEDIKHIAGYLGIEVSLVRQILHNDQHHYRIFYIKKSGGKYRQIESPRTYLKVIQWWILDNVLQSADFGQHVQGFVRGRGYVSNAQLHLGAAHILNVDIRRFFPSITFDMVRRVFSSLGYMEGGSTLLAGLCTLRGVAPTGAPTSPAIGNLVLAQFDAAVSQMASEENCKYTRYADDLTFSSSNFIPPSFAERVSELIRLNGFTLNSDKTRFMGQGDRMEVTGLVINKKLNLSREWRNRTRAFIHRLERNPDTVLSFLNELKGTYGCLKSVDVEEAQPLTRRARQLLEGVGGLSRGAGSPTQTQKS